MRAGLAALSVLILPVLAASAVPAAAQCTAAEALARPAAAAGPAPHGPDRLAAPPLPLPVTGHQPAAAPAGALDPPPASRSHAAMLGTTPRMAMRTDALAAQMPTPLAARPTPYQPYQSHVFRAAPLTSEEVAPSLRARGFVDVSAVRQRGRSFLAEATGPRGERVRLVLDAESGEISGMQVIGFIAVP